MPKKKRPKGLQHIGIERRTLKQEPWRGLSAAAKIFYIHLKGRYNGLNNGDIRLPYSAMKDVKGCSHPRTISAALKELQHDSWIRIRIHGGLYRHNNYYELTFEHDFYGCESSQIIQKERKR